MKEHIEAPRIEQWTKLFEAAKALKQLAPWNYLWDSDLIAIAVPGIKEPFFCSVMGRIGECYAIGVYPGYNEFSMGYYRMAESYSRELSYLAWNNINGFMCNFGDREEVAPEDRKVYKALNLKFRGRNEWIYFRSLAPGFFPWYLNAQEADLLIIVLQNLCIACQHLIDGKVKINFNYGEYLLRFYSPEKEQWLNKVEEKLMHTISIANLQIEDELFIAGLKKRKQNRRQIELDITYLPTPIQEHKDERPYLPRIFIIVDRKSGFIFTHEVFGPDESIEAVIIGTLADHIEKNGKPSTIYVRDEITSGYIADLCQKIGVKLIKGKGLPTVDMIITDILRFMG